MNEWEQIVDFGHDIYVFGATASAQLTTQFVYNWTDTSIKGYIVSQPEDNPDYFNGKKVYSLYDFNEQEKKQIYIIISQSWGRTKDITNMLRANGFENVYASATQIKTELTDDDWSKVEKMFACGKKGDTNQEKLSCTIYAVTSHLNLHKQMKEYNSEYITYIQAGAALTDISMCDVKDNIGENISEKNPYYCELTAGYWAAKNNKESDYLGLYHYSRGLDLADEELESFLCKNNQVIVSNPYGVRYSMMCRLHREDYERIRAAVLSVNAQYEESVDAYFLQSFFIPGNIMVASRIIFCEYYDWMMKVMETCEKLLLDSYGDEVPKRIWGYYGEHLHNIYLIHHRNEYDVSFAKAKNMMV